MTDRRCEARREALRAKIAEKDLGGLLVVQAANRYYLSGFELHDPQCNESAGWLLITRHGPDFLLTDPRYEEAALAVWPGEHLHIYTPPKFEDIRSFIGDNIRGRLGFEPNMAWSDVNELRKSFAVEPAPAMVEELRRIKDEAEIDVLRRSCRLNHAACAAVPGMLTPGRSEAEVAWDIERFYRERGASALSFSTIVGVDRNAARPHAIPGEDKVRDGCLVLVDMGCRLDDYCSDQTRTFWVGERPSERFVKVRDRVREAQQAAIDLVRPGVAVRELFEAAWKVFESCGEAEHFTHALGHGIGLETHERPSLGRRAEDMLEPGMVVTVEPGLYYPDWGGVRWEYMVLVTEEGAEVL